VTVWIDGATILERAGNANPTTEDSEWADAAASAVNAGIDRRIEGSPIVAPPIDPPVPVDPAAFPELLVAASYAGVETYKRKEAAFGLTGYVDLQGAAIRVARDYLEAVAPIIARYATFGLA